LLRQKQSGCHLGAADTVDQTFLVLKQGCPALFLKLFGAAKRDCWRLYSELCSLSTAGGVAGLLASACACLKNQFIGQFRGSVKMRIARGVAARLFWAYYRVAKEREGTR
jgi:hypothetical protein